MRSIIGKEDRPAEFADNEFISTAKLKQHSTSSLLPTELLAAINDTSNTIAANEPLQKTPLVIGEQRQVVVLFAVVH